MLRIKRAVSHELREEIFSLRYRAYFNEGAIHACSSERFQDAYDLQPNHVLWALTEHDKVVGSIRSTWFDPAQSQWSIPEIDGYGDDVSRSIPSDARILSGNRFVTDPSRSDKGGLWAMLLLRRQLATAQKYADYALAAVRQNHLGFYRHILKMNKFSEGKTYPGLTSTMFLLGCDYRECIEKIYASTPRLKARGYERMLMDEQYMDIWEHGLPVEY